MLSRNCVLIFGHDDVLTQTRTLILNGSGFQVWTAATVEQATAAIASHPIETMILCQTLSAKERESAIALGETLRPEMKVLALQDECVSVPEHTSVKVVEAFVAPISLIAVIKQMTGGAMATSPHN